MSGEVEAYRPRELASAPAEGRRTLGEWAEAAGQAAGIAKILARTPFIPESLRVFDDDPDGGEPVYNEARTVANVAATLLTGDELAIPPMASLRSIDVINGTPALRALALRALLLRAGHLIEVVESTTTLAVVRGRRAGGAAWQTSTWTIDRAQKLGLAGKKNWAKQPAAMLVARATSEVARWVAPDEVLAMPYVAEELDDDGTVDASPVPVESAARPARRTARRKPLPASPGVEKSQVAADEPPLDDASPAAAAAVAGDEPALDDTATADQADGDADVVEEAIPEPSITAAQSKALHAGLGAVGLRDRDTALATIGEWVGRPIESTKDLTAAEASVVIDVLRLTQEQGEDVPPLGDDPGLS